MNTVPGSGPGGAARGDDPDWTFPPAAAPPTTDPQPQLPLAARVWLALWAPLPFLNWLSVLGVLRLGRLPLALRWLLGGFVALQLLSAVFTAHPLAAGIIGLLRSLFLVGLLMTGWQLGRARQLLALLPGLLVVLVTALVYSALHAGLLTARLSHPTYQSVSLGLAAALTLWLAVFWPAKQGGQQQARWDGWQPWLRGAAAALALLVLVLGSSRAPLGAALLGLLAGGVWAALSARSRPSRAGGALGWVLTATLLLGGGATFWAGQNTAGARLTGLGLNSRDTYWEEAANVFRANPLGGAGVGQLGNAVLSNQDNCFQGWKTNSVGCQDWMLRLSAEPWFAPARKLSWMAHNAPLHALAETGVVGAAGYFLMLGLVLAAAAASRSPLLVALVTGYSVVNLFDNSTMLPSLAVSEVFWLAGGVALREAYSREACSGASSPGRWTGGRPLALAPLWGGGLLLVSLLPVVLPLLAPARGAPPALLALNTARQTTTSGHTTLWLGLGSLSPGPARLRLQLCSPVCGVQRVQPLTPDMAGEWWGTLPLPPLKRGTTVRLQLLPPETGLLSARPLGEFVWKQP